MSISSLMSICGAGGIGGFVTVLILSTSLNSFYNCFEEKSACSIILKKKKVLHNYFKMLLFVTVVSLISDYPVWFDSTWFLAQLWLFRRWLHHWCLKDTVPLSKWLPQWIPKVLLLKQKQYELRIGRLRFASRSPFFFCAQNHFLLHWSITKQQLLSRSQRDALQGGWGKVGKGETWR